MSNVGVEAYRREIDAVLPRLLALYDRDKTSPTLGIGDRLYWSWKLIDFPNATSQGAVNGLARLLANNLLPTHLSRRAILERIDEMIGAVARISDTNGSLSEAFPREGSFCVTALIAYDILCAAEHLEQHVERSHILRWLSIVEPLIAFLIRNDESHAVISNHLATAVAALMRWRGKSEEAARNRGRALLQRILDHQSKEGWFSEYGGFDPGYETLGLTYLADVHQRDPGLGLKPHLMRSLDLLTHAAHPDGSFGGVYGARNTRFILPGGLEALAPEFAPARALASFARTSISTQTVVTLSTIDEGNLAPIFNSYCMALTAHSATEVSAPTKLPCEMSNSWRRHLPIAGLLIDNADTHYTIVSLNKGGVVQHYPKGNHAPLIDPGAVGTRHGRIFSTQANNPNNRLEFEADHIVIEATFTETKSERPTAFKFILLRVACLTLFRYRALLEWTKRVLVKRLITGQKPIDVRNRRTIYLGPNLRIEDQCFGGQLERVKSDPAVRAIHMASSGYWQRQDDDE